MKKYIVMTMIICMLLCTTSQAAIYVPDFSTTYIPPSVESMMDILYNAYGVTAPNLSTGKLQAYLTLYRGVLGAAYDKFFDDIQNVFNKAKTSGKLVIDNALSVQLQSGMYNALTQGFPSGVSYPMQVNPSQWSERLLRQYGLTITTSQCQSLYSDYKRSYSDEPLLLFCVNGLGNEITLCCVSSVSYPNAHYAKNPSNNYYYVYNNNSLVSSVVFHRCSYNSTTKTVGSLSSSGLGTGAVTTMSLIGTTAAFSETVTLQAQSGVEEKLSTQSLDVITADTVIDNGVIDDTKPIVITLPNIRTVPSTTIADVDDVQDDIGAKPYIDGDVSQAVADLQNQQNNQYGDIYAYAVDLTEYFPFCIPFDIAHALTLFIAEPQAPNFDFTLPVGYDLQEGVLWDDFNIDLSMFDEVAAWARKFELLAFIVGLAAVTRQLYLRG